MRTACLARPLVLAWILAPASAQSLSATLAAVTGARNPEVRVALTLGGKTDEVGVETDFGAQSMAPVRVRPGNYLSIGVARSPGLYLTRYSYEGRIWHHAILAAPAAHGALDLRDLGCSSVTPLGLPALKPEQAAPLLARFWQGATRQRRLLRGLQEAWPTWIGVNATKVTATFVTCVVFIPTGGGWILCAKKSADTSLDLVAESLARTVDLIRKEEPQLLNDADARTLKALLAVANLGKSLLLAPDTLDGKPEMWLAMAGEAALFGADLAVDAAGKGPVLKASVHQGKDLYEKYKVLLRAAPR